MPESTFLVQQPQQARSRETMGQILDATAQILETKTFEELTVAEIVRRAGTSVGAFYGRFKDKESLLQALDERFFQVFETRVAAFFASPGSLSGSLADLVEGAARLMVQTYSENKGVLRSLNLMARLYGDTRFKMREQRAWDELFPRLQLALLAHRGEITHPDPGLATRLGFQQLFFALREILLWEPLREELPYGTEVLVAELGRAYLAYLGAKAPGP